MRYFFYLAATTSIIVASAFKPSMVKENLKASEGPSGYYILSKMCYDLDGNFTGVGNTCIKGTSVCVPNPCDQPAI
jgi:hypothetical protein